MKLFEYQAKCCFAAFDIRTPQGELVTRPDEVAGAVGRIGLPCVIKAQMLRGGRGKLGLVRRVGSIDEAQQIAGEMFSSSYDVRSLLVEQYIEAASEAYLSISTDPVRAEAVVMLSGKGGVDIEQVAQDSPGLVHKEYISVLAGPDAAKLESLVNRAGLCGELAERMLSLIYKLYSCFIKYDAELAEINPVFITRNQHIIAGDGKLVIDDNSLFRQPEFTKTREHYSSDMEYEAALQGIPYIQFDGEISLMCAGAGLTTTVYDLICDEGGSVSNYLEFGGPNYNKAETAMRICLMNKSSVILIVTFGTIARADVIAEGVVKACAQLRPDRPLITCIRGTNEDEASRILKEAGLECYTDTEEAVKRAIELAGGKDQNRA